MSRNSWVVQVWQIAAAVVVLASPARGQSLRARLGDSSEVAVNTYERLFLGITLSKADRAKAEEAIRTAFVRRHRMQPIMSQEEWRALLAVQDHRDSVLVSLVQDPQQRETLRGRLAENRPTSSRWKP